MWVGFVCWVCGWVLLNLRDFWSRSVKILLNCWVLWLLVLSVNFGCRLLISHWDSLERGMGLFNDGYRSGFHGHSGCCFSWMCLRWWGVALCGAEEQKRGVQEWLQIRQWRWHLTISISHHLNFSEKGTTLTQTNNSLMLIQLTRDFIFLN